MCLGRASLHHFKHDLEEGLESMQHDILHLPSDLEHPAASGTAGSSSGSGHQLHPSPTKATKFTSQRVAVAEGSATSQPHQPLGPLPHALLTVSVDEDELELSGCEGALCEMDWTTDPVDTLGQLRECLQSERGSAVLTVLDGSPGALLDAIGLLHLLNEVRLSRVHSCISQMSILS